MPRHPKPCRRRRRTCSRGSCGAQTVAVPVGMAQAAGTGLSGSRTYGGFGNPTDAYAPARTAKNHADADVAFGSRGALSGRTWRVEYQDSTVCGDSRVGSGKTYAHAGALDAARDATEDAHMAWAVSTAVSGTAWAYGSYHEFS